MGRTVSCRRTATSGKASERERRPPGCYRPAGAADEVELVGELPVGSRLHEEALGDVRQVARIGAVEVDARVTAGAAVVADGGLRDVADVLRHDEAVDGAVARA